MSPIHAVKLMTSSCELAACAPDLLLNAACVPACSRRGAWNARAAAITDSSLVSPQALLWYRAASFAWCLFVNVTQALRKGWTLAIFKFYTVCEWCRQSTRPPAGVSTWPCSQSAWLLASAVSAHAHHLYSCTSCWPGSWDDHQVPLQCMLCCLLPLHAGLGIAC